MRRPTYLFVLHTSHAGLFMVLFATAVLLLFPDLRARFVGGYSTILKEVHLWFGAASVLVPVAIYAASRRWPKLPPWKVTGWLRGVHVRYTYLVTLVFAATGLVMWQPDYFSIELSDLMFSAHEWLTYAVAGVLLVHLGIVAAKRLGALYGWATASRGIEDRAKEKQERNKVWLEEDEGLRRVVGGQR